MKKAYLRVLPIVALLALGALRPYAASAQAVYMDFQSYTDYCTSAGSTCVNPITGQAMSGFNYAEVDAKNYTNPGIASAWPDYAYLECDHATTNASGVLQYQFSYVEAYTQAYATAVGRTGGARGKISGSATVPMTGESSTSAFSSIVLGATDPVVGTSGTAQGSQITDNAADTVLSSNIRISILGTLYNYHFDPTAKRFVFDGTSTGSISCVTTGVSRSVFGVRSGGEAEMEAIGAP